LLTPRFYHTVSVRDNFIYVFAGKGNDMDNKGNEIVHSDLFIQMLCPFYFSAIPEVLLISILSYLDVQDLIRLSMTSKLFHKYLNDQRIWREIYKRYFPNEKITSDTDCMGLLKQDSKVMWRFK